MAETEDDTLPKTPKSGSNPPTNSALLTSDAPSQPTQRRTPSVRFSEDEHPASQSSMSTRRLNDSSDEITPIRQADNAGGRTYNTTDHTAQLAPTTAKKPSSTPTAGQQTQPAEEKIAWYKRLAEKYGSVSLDNKGSVARDHLALERTFLAWLRTSLAFASIGIAVTQLFRLNVSIQGKSQSAGLHTYAGSGSQLPYSPMLGHGLPAELVPVLQQLATAGVPSLPRPGLGPTLLDQLLLLPSLPDQYSSSQMDFHNSAFDKRAAAKLRHVGKPLGATFIGISIIVLCVGFHRYFEAQYWIMRGKFPASRGGIALVGLIAGALIVASLIVVVAVAPGSYEKKR